MKDIKWKGNKQEFLEFAKDYVVNIHQRCRDPKTPEDHQLIKDMKNVEIQIIGTLNGVDVLEINFVQIQPKTIPTAEEFISNHYGEIYDRRPDKFKSFISREKYIELHGLGKIDGVEKSNKDLLIEFATMHVQACKEDIAASVKLSDELHEFISDSWEGGDWINKATILNAYPESNIS